ncbi:MAG: type VI secretion system baseplate subunit TssK [Holosporaceae bacterium]|jgi:type VI secretion system protein ImpJ|nr:type VI secretion system baseplate subunit TssK [Holosporaceae bacterium]
MKSFIQWHEGMLLSPHHFQQLNSNIQHLLSAFSTASTSFGFGVYDLKIDTSALASGVIRILNVCGIFQDGFYFDFDALHDQPLEKNLVDYFTGNSAAVKVYLAIPVRRDGENSVQGDVARYYSSEISNISDENTGENAINIPILKPRLKLLLEKEVDARYVSFPIFEAEKSMDGGVVSTKFLPPFIVLDEHSRILEICREVAQIIRNKVSYFSDRKDNYSQSTTDETMSCLRLLIQSALPLEAIIRINGIQPFEIYKCLLDAVSKIVSVNPTQLIPRLPIYNHSDLFSTFDSLLQYARNILNHLKQQYEIVHFTKEGSVFKLQMKKEWLEKDEIAIGIQKAFSTSDDEILAWIRGVLIASESMFLVIRDKRVLGAERKIMERGAYITQPNGTTIISVKTQTSYIKSLEKLCLSNPSVSITPGEVVLYAECR